MGGPVNARRLPTAYLEQPCRAALHHVVGMGFEWSLNPYVGCAHRCTFCYVRSFERRADRASDERYGRTVRVKVNIAERLRWELSRRSWQRQSVHIGTATDPYQPAEGSYRLTRACLVALDDFRTPAALITRGPMAVRDIDVLATMTAHAGATVIFSVPTLDDAVWRTTEPGTAPPRARLRALERLRAAGVNAGVAVAPILPGLSDGADSLAAVLAAARRSGASFVWPSMVRLQPGTREHFIEALSRDWPELVPRYQQIFAGRTSVPSAVAAPALEAMASLRARWGFSEQPAPRREPPAAPRQLALRL
ncbi:MAG: radical SAM protein [Chloroflexi bacterium]|nr:MAG: radical SAM protein [Chloroflexota bacterium]